MTPAEEQERRLAARGVPLVYVPPLLPPVEQPWTETTELPTSAASLQRKAEAAGWTARGYRCRGPYIGADGSALGVADGAALLFFYGGPVEAWACWYRRADKWALEGAWLLRPIIRLGGNDIGHWLAGTTPKGKT